jgi:hypothetical protein
MFTMVRISFTVTVRSAPQSPTHVEVGGDNVAVVVTVSVGAPVTVRVSVPAEVGVGVPIAIGGAVQVSPGLGVWVAVPVHVAGGDGAVVGVEVGSGGATALMCKLKLPLLPSLSPSTTMMIVWPVCSASDSCDWRFEAPLM